MTVSLAMHPPTTSGVSRDRQCCPVKSDEPENLTDNAIGVDGAPTDGAWSSGRGLALFRDKEMSYVCTHY
jgi:hypothetical protein